MSVLDAVRDLQNQTAWQQATDKAREIEDSKNGVSRNVGGMMGKNDFLMLLSAQLRYQDPLNPQNDSDFAAQLAQFSALEQMQNMNSTLSVLSSFQSYSLIGKYVIAEAVIDGKLMEIPGVVDSIFTNNGVTFAQVGEYVVPVSSIREVFDTSNILTSEMLIQTSNNLIGRTVIARVGNDIIEGVVTRVMVDKGTMLAQIDDGTDEPKFVPVNTIADVRETGTKALMPKPDVPPNAINFKSDDNGGFIELNADGTKELGLWTWNVAKWAWVYQEFDEDSDEGSGDGSGEDHGEGYDVA